MLLMLLVWRFLTVTPLLVTSEGSRPWAEAMRFCTLTMAMSGSVPWRKYTWMLAEPVLVAVDTMYIMFSTPFMASSSGTMTLFCTVAALAPVYVALTLIVGGAISGNCSIGRLTREITPTRSMATEMTPDRMGLSMKVLMFMPPVPPLR